MTLPGKRITWAAGSRVGVRAVMTGDARLRERRALVSAHRAMGTPWSPPDPARFYLYLELGALG